MEPPIHSHCADIKANLRTHVEFDEATKLMKTVSWLEQKVAEFQWRPIKTAPKDGTYILLYRPAEDGRQKDAVREGKYHRYGMNDTWRVRSGGVWDIDAPTHWMPMPNPPEGGSDE